MIIERIKALFRIYVNHYRGVSRFSHKKVFFFFIALSFIALIYQRHKRQKKLQQAVLAKNNRCNVIRSPSILEGINALNEIESDVKKGNGKFVMLPNGRVHYRIEGSKEAPLLVMCHGFGVFCFVFEGIINHFVNNGYKVLVFDWYAHGFSEAPNPDDNKYNADLFVNQLNDLLSALSLNKDPFCLMGHSMGGLLAAIYASRYPQKIKKLILICPAGSKVWKPNDSIYLSIVQSAHALAKSPLLGVPVLKIALALADLLSSTHLRMTSNKRSISYNSLKKIPESLSTDSGHSLGLRENERPHQSTRFLQMVDMSTKALCFQNKVNAYIPEALNSIMTHLDLFGEWGDTFKAIDSNSHETLLIWGDSDEFVPYRNCTEYLMRLMPSAEVVAFREADHFVFLNRPRQFVEAVLEFLSQKPRPSKNENTSNRKSTISTFV